MLIHFAGVKKHPTVKALGQREMFGDSDETE
jgi:hypothetical protein